MNQDPYKIINDQFDFENSAIIKPKTVNFDDTHRVPVKTAHVIVNSADRNIVAYPTPSDYIANLYEEIQDVTSCELKVALLPHNPYNITNSNNSLVLNGVLVTLSPGIYDGDTLATRLTTKCSTILALTIVFDNVSQHFILSSNSAFRIEMPSSNKGSLLKLMGLPHTPSQDTTFNGIFNSGSGRYELESMYAADLAPNNTIIMNIDTMYVKTSANNVFNRAYGLIPQQLIDHTIGDVYSIKKVFPQPVPRIDKLRIRFSDIYGNPYDFQNKDHILEFSFNSHKNIRKYQAYV